MSRGIIVGMADTARIFDNPLHPYTRMLVAAVPRLDQRWADREGEVLAFLSAGGGACTASAAGGDSAGAAE